MTAALSFLFAAGYVALGAGVAFRHKWRKHEPLGYWLGVTFCGTVAGLLLLAGFSFAERY